MTDYDIVVLGGGSGGLATAKTAATCGAKVAIAEPVALGGTCINRGCVPKKLMVYAANFARQRQSAKAYGWRDLSGSFDWSAFKATMTAHIQKLRQSQQDSLQSLGIEVLPERAKFVDRHTVQVGDRQITANNFVLAVGGHPILPGIPGAELALTSKDMFHLEHLPKRFAIVGGGYIGIEFGHFLAQLGSQVTIIDLQPQILAGFETDLRAFVQENLQHLGITFLPETTCKQISEKAGQRVLSLAGKFEQTLSVDAVLMAVGRAPNFAGLGLENAGVKLNEGQLVVDEQYRTSHPAIYAIGDCVGRLPLTPVAIAEGKAVAQTICRQTPTVVDYRWTPSAVFSAPPVATVGWSESKAKHEYGEDVEVTSKAFVPLHQSFQESPQKFFIKCVSRQSSGEILGLHIAGDNAPEVIQGFIPMLRQQLTVSRLVETIGIHPTSAEELFSLSK